MMVAYNVQSTVDAQHCLVADFSVENQKDNYLLAPMGASVKEALSIEDGIELLADKGYHGGKGLQECAENGITTYVAFPEQAYGDRPKGFQKPDFKYDEGKDVYLCPAKRNWPPPAPGTRSWAARSTRRAGTSCTAARSRSVRPARTVTSASPSRTSGTAHGRTIERSEHERAVLGQPGAPFVEPGQVQA